MTNTLKTAFTLIELLVVVAIIGIVLAISTISYLTAQKQVRDTRRKTDLMEIRQVLETYRSENGQYPSAATWTTDLTPEFITLLPTYPSGSVYTYLPSGIPLIAYSLCTTLEIAPTSPLLTNCAPPANYEVQNP